ARNSGAHEVSANPPLRTPARPTTQQSRAQPGAISLPRLRRQLGVRKYSRADDRQPCAYYVRVCAFVLGGAARPPPSLRLCGPRAHGIIGERRSPRLPGRCPVAPEVVPSGTNEKQVIMKAGIHPKYVKSTVHCACGNTFETESVKPEIRVEICSNC